MRAVTFAGNGVVEVVEVPDPGLTISAAPGVLPRRCEHGVIVRTLATCICGSDLHTLRSPSSTEGMVMGHELVGVVEDVGRDVEHIRKGAFCIVPFNVACGRCANCRSGLTGHCLTTNPERPGATYGMGVSFGGWAGLQAEYAVVPYADFNLTVVPDPQLVERRLIDLALLGDVAPTGLHAALSADVGVGAAVYVAGAGPVGLAAAVASRLLGAAVVVLGDPNEHRRSHAEDAGFVTVDPSTADLSAQLRSLVGGDGVDAAIDCVGVSGAAGAPALADVASVARPGGRVVLAGVYPAASVARGAELQAGQLWAKALTARGGVTPAAQYVDRLLNAVRAQTLTLAHALGAQSVPLTQAAEAYAAFAAGDIGKVVLVP